MATNPPEHDINHVERFERDGYTVVAGLFTLAELEPLRAALRQDPSVGGGCFEMLDVDGGTLDAIAWTERSDTLLGMLPFAERTLRLVTALAHEEVYHWHSKLTIKRPNSLGRVEWHQDYGAWYYEGCLRPDLITVGIALEPCTRDNGCLSVVRGSHHLGRMDHEYLADAQHRVEPDRLAQAMQHMTTEQVEMQVGDVILFHCNTLHGSGANRTDSFRILLLSTYNTAANSPVGEHQSTRRYRPLDPVPDSAIGAARYSAVIEGHPFLRPEPEQMQGFGTNAYRD